MEPVKLTVRRMDWSETSQIFDTTPGQFVYSADNSPEALQFIVTPLDAEKKPFFSSGKLVNHIHAVFPISEVEAAQAILRRAENIGKVVLTLD